MKPTLVCSLCALLLTPSAGADPPPFTWLDRAVVAEATRRAVERAGFAADASRAMASRARSAAWLPQVSVRVARGSGATTTQYTAATSDRQLLDDSLFVDVRVSLALDRLVFDPHEVNLWRAELVRAERRLQLEASVLDALARVEELRRARAAEAPDTPPDPAWELDTLRARARVELLTGAPLESLAPR